VAYVLAVEKLARDRKATSAACQFIRVICCELARVSRHLLGVGSSPWMWAHDGFLHTFTEREKIYNLCESLTGARFTTSYTRIGGLSAICRRAGSSNAQILNEVVVNIDETETLLTRNRIFVDRTQGVGVISGKPIDTADGPNLRGSGVDYDLRKANLTWFTTNWIRGARRLSGDSYDRYLVRIEENAPERSPRPQCLDKLPDGSGQCAGWKIVLPPRKGADANGGVDPSFPECHQGINAPPGKFISGTKIRKGSWAFTSTARRRDALSP
jgi:NADH-quinone oxidoreductase subunit D